MQISLRDLRALKLSPNATAIAVIMVDSATAQGRAYARTVDIVDELGISRPTAQRAIAELITAGFMSRVVRGVYQICVSEEVSPVSEERSPVSVSRYVRTTNSHKQETKEIPNGISGADAPKAPNENPKGITVVTYDDGDDLGGVGMVEPKPEPEPRKRRRSVPSLHRNVPREQWTMDFVYKEFNHRLFLWSRKTGKDLPGDQEKPLKAALRTWALDYGLTPQEAATLCDRFFDSTMETAKFGKGQPVYRQFLYYVKVNLTGLRGTVISDEFVESLYEQDVPW
jgi:hypothetical protein